MLLFTVWLEKENRRDRKHGREFFLPGPLFFPPKLGGKCEEKSDVKAFLHKYSVSFSFRSYKHNNLSLIHL